MADLVYWHTIGGYFLTLKSGMRGEMSFHFHRVASAVALQVEIFSDGLFKQRQERNVIRVIMTYPGGFCEKRCTQRFNAML